MQGFHQIKPINTGYKAFTLQVKNSPPVAFFLSLFAESKIGVFICLQTYLHLSSEWSLSLHNFPP